jgi:hypothetical protein
VPTLTIFTGARLGSKPALSSARQPADSTMLAFVGNLMRPKARRAVSTAFTHALNREMMKTSVGSNLDSPIIPIFSEISAPECFPNFAAGSRREAATAPPVRWRVGIALRPQNAPAALWRARRLPMCNGTSISSVGVRDRTGYGIVLRYRVVATVGTARGESKMAAAIGLLIFAGVIGSHGYLWWSCRRNGGSLRI